MGAALANKTDAHLARLAHGLEGVLGVELGSRRDKLAAGRVWAEDAGFPGRAVLEDGLEEGLLLLAGKDRLDDGAGNGLGAAAGRHLGLVGGGLVDHDGQTVLAVGVAAW